MLQCFRLIPRTLVVFSVLTLMWVFTGEIGIFYAYSLSWRWPVSQLGFTSGELVTAPKLRMLLLSDPHIQCTFNRYESWLLRWDADQYLKRSFSLLVGTLQPEMVVILGDIFAEGFKASPQEWRDYLQALETKFIFEAFTRCTSLIPRSLPPLVSDLGFGSNHTLEAMKAWERILFHCTHHKTKSCLKATFPIPDAIKFLALPGDNDIGGEGIDAMNEEVNRRYISQFGEMNFAHTYKGVVFIKLNTVSYIHVFPWNSVETQAREQLNNFVASMKQNQSATEHNKRLTVSFSHVPLNELQDHNLKTNILNSLRPNYIFSGHIHYTMYTTHTYAEGRVAKEFTLPTCSYRMGQARMGVGAVVIGENDDLAYEVLWLPGRYPFLVSYAILCGVLVLVAVWSVTRRQRNWYKCCR